MTSEPPTSRAPVLPIALALVLSAVLASAVVWWRGEPDTAAEHFDSCSLEGGTLTLHWTEGVGDVATITVDERSDEIVVTLVLDAPDGPRPAVGVLKQAQYSVGDDVRTVRHADDTALTCTDASTAQPAG